MLGGLQRISFPKIANAKQNKKKATPNKQLTSTSCVYLIKSLHRINSQAFACFSDWRYGGWEGGTTLACNSPSKSKAAAQHLAWFTE